MSLRVASMLLAFLGLACVTPYDPFRVPAADLRTRIDTIALAPFYMDGSLGDEDSLGEELERMFTARLEARGLRVLPMELMREVWRRTGSEVGALYDPKTGKVDSERREAVEDEVYRELATAHEVDAILYSRVYLVDLYLVGSNVNLCGQKRRAYWGGDSFWGKATLVRGACLGVVLCDMEERELYGIRAGIETVETYALQTRARRPVAERFRNRAQLDQAVEAVVGPLADGVGGSNR